MLVNLNCPNCGAGLPPSFNISGLVKCAYCGTTFHVPETLTPEPDMGDLLLGADFRQKPIAGWQFQNEEKMTLLPGPPPELCARFPKSNLVHYVLYSSGILDNLDASVTLRFPAGDVKWIRAGLFLRYDTALGGYGAFVSAQGTYMFGYYDKPANDNLAWHTMIDWTAHTSLRAGLNLPNRLRLLANGRRIQIYLNGVLAASFADSRFEVGQVRLAVESSENSDIEAAFSDLQIRGVRN
jgi:hypothetical protein